MLRLASLEIDRGLREAIRNNLNPSMADHYLGYQLSVNTVVDTSVSNVRRVVQYASCAKSCWSVAALLICDHRAAGAWRRCSYVI
eukprot:6202960-Pleurochrysis_carterae.AAC.2